MSPRIVHKASYTKPQVDALIAGFLTDSEIADLPPSGRHLVSGRYYFPDYDDNSSNEADASVIGGGLKFFGQDTTIDRIVLNQGTSVAATFRLGIYVPDDQTRVTGTYTNILDAGEVASATAGVKEIVVSQVVPRGWAWLCGTTDGSQFVHQKVAPRSRHQSDMGYADGTYGVTAFGLLTHTDAAPPASALPTTLTITTSHFNQIALAVGVRVA